MSRTGGLAWVLLALLACGCEKDAQETKRTSNGDFDVALLFSYDGCDVFRFEDQRSHYFVRCRDAKSASVSETHSEHDGRNHVTTWTEEVPTVEVRK